MINKECTRGHHKWDQLPDDVPGIIKKEFDRDYFICTKCSKLGNRYKKKIGKIFVKGNPSRITLLYYQTKLDRLG